MQVEADGLIYDSTTKPASERIAAFVGLSPLESGTLLCSFQLGSKKHGVDSTVRVCRSRDDGASWQELPARFERSFQGVPGSLSSGEIVEVEPGRLLMIATWFDRSDPQRPLFDPETQGILPSKQLLAVSTDEGESWSDWSELPIPNLTGCSSTGPILKWSDGTIAYPFESYKQFDDPAPAKHGAWFLISRDGGRTFEEPFLVARDPQQNIYYWDERLCVGEKNGEFVATFWTHDLEKKQDIDVHFRRASISENSFEESPIRSTGIPGQIAAPAVLEDGRILAFVVDRGRPSTMTLWQSGDGGRTWPRGEALVVYTHNERALLSQGTTDVDYNEYWEDMAKWSFGHPAIRSLDENRVLCAYYAGTPNCMSVHWARVDAG